MSILCKRRDKTLISSDLLAQIFAVYVDDLGLNFTLDDAEEQMSVILADAKEVVNEPSDSGRRGRGPDVLAYRS